MAEFPRQIRQVGGGMESHRSPLGPRRLLPAEADLCNALGIEESDYWFVFEDLNKLENNQTKIDKRNIVFLSAETSWPEDYYFTKSKKDYLNQFQKIYLFGLKTPEDISTKKIILDLPFLPWMINANHGDSYLSPNKRDLTYLTRLWNQIRNQTLKSIAPILIHEENHIMRHHLENIPNICRLVKF